VRAVRNIFYRYVIGLTEQKVEADDIISIGSLPCLMRKDELWSSSASGFLSVFYR
jgi:hypothetical protein